MILDGGPARLGLESTVVDARNDPPLLLRPGAVSREEIERVLGATLVQPAAPERPSAPGQLASHYAPRAKVRLEARQVASDEALLAFGPDVPQGALHRVNLSPTGDLREAAANLFSHMLALDRTGAKTIAVEPIPNSGLGEAINDRLSRAAAPRDQPLDTA